MFESIPNDALGWTIIVLLVIIVVLLLRRNTNEKVPGKLRIHQGGTQPIVAPVKDVVVGRATSSFKFELHPGHDDDSIDKYWIEAYRIRPTWEGMVDGPGGTKVRAPVKWDITNVAIDGLKGGKFLEEKQFNLKEGTQDGAAMVEVTVPLHTATDNDIVTFAIYRAKGTRSNITTVEIVKSN